MRNIVKLILLLSVILVINVKAQYSIYEKYDPTSAKYSLDDLGTMWTFDAIPFERLEEKYSFTPTEEWLEHVRLSALQFGNGCSGSFISGDGLIMTNHHCGRGDLYLVQKEGENLLRDGYLATSKEEERRIPDTFVDQLISIKDVTDEVYEALNAGSNDDEKVRLREEKIREIEKKIEEETGLVCRVIPFYNGGKYKAYSYKRYNDIRLVMAPDFQIAATGWDWDNFTYPRYELDFAFYRAYDEKGNPVQAEHFFKWSEKGAEDGETVFTIGRPGRTRRLISVAEMEYLRDYEYTYTLSMLNEAYKVYYELLQARPENEAELLNMVMNTGNGRKSYAGRLLGLRDAYVMQKKIDFENNLKLTVKNDKELSKKYGHVWDSINIALEELKKNIAERTAFTLPRRSQSYYYNIAAELIKYAEQLKLPENERENDYVNGNAEKHIKGLFPPSFDYELNSKLLRAHINYVTGILGKDHWLIKNWVGELKDEEAVKYLLSKSHLTSAERIIELAKNSPDSILNSDDPFIYFLVNTRDKLAQLENIISESRNTLSVLNQMLGEIVFAVHGENIPPDATSSLRISDGVLAGYEYNGTIAPAKTTYFGLYDRYYSFNQKTYPWGLHPRWLNPPVELNLATPIAFASTNDTVGGNSGSSIINTKGEIVGLLHDGNLEGLVADFIFLPENNRAVATDSYGLMEALKYIFKAQNLVKEIEAGKIVE